jgi:hypothetical protein
MPTVMMCDVDTVGGVKTSAMHFLSPSVTGLGGFAILRKMSLRTQIKLRCILSHARFSLLSRQFLEHH